MLKHLCILQLRIYSQMRNNMRFDRARYYREYSVYEKKSYLLSTQKSTVFVDIVGIVQFVFVLRGAHIAKLGKLT